MKKRNLILLGLGIASVSTIISRNIVKPKNLGVVKGRLHEIPNRPSAVSTETIYHNKRVETLPFKGDLEESKEKIVKVLNCIGGILVLRVEYDYIYAVSTTPLLRYHDDIEFYFDEKLQCIHYRSCSRVPYYDFGTNKNRYLKIRDYYFHLV